MPNTDLPASVARIARRIGRDAALALAGACANGRIYVPRKIPEAHKIAQVIGLTAAATLARSWGGEILYLAKCHEVRIRFRNEAIRRWAGEGRSRRELADLTGLTERQISNVLAEKSPPMDAHAARGKVRA